MRTVYFFPGSRVVVRNPIVIVEASAEAFRAFLTVLPDSSRRAMRVWFPTTDTGWPKLMLRVVSAEKTLSCFGVTV